MRERSLGWGAGGCSVREYFVNFFVFTKEFLPLYLRRNHVFSGAHIFFLLYHIIIPLFVVLVYCTGARSLDLSGEFRIGGIAKKYRKNSIYEYIIRYAAK